MDKVNSHGSVMAAQNQSAASIRAQHGEEGAIQEVARQFEAQFLQTVLKQMRSATDALKDEDSALSDKRGVFHDFYDAEMASAISQQHGVGLREVMVRQLGGELKPDAEPVALSAIETDHQREAMARSTAMQPALVLPLSVKES
ncbi:hypothetical protein GCM10023333_22440 [Ferrimonas pelagia]|uniref:Flagellar protein FlgJ N-terminal domain-containing protein n=2 Tax=Ferrimonas pelagia TaxID=1177826 RepID=A0ABP9EY39_9GAMM